VAGVTLKWAPSAAASQRYSLPPGQHGDGVRAVHLEGNGGRQQARCPRGEGDWDEGDWDVHSLSGPQQPSIKAHVKAWGLGQGALQADPPPCSRRAAGGSRAEPPCLAVAAAGSLQSLARKH